MNILIVFRFVNRNVAEGEEIEEREKDRGGLTDIHTDYRQQNRERKK